MQPPPLSPFLPSPSMRPRTAVLLPSPRGVGEIPVTSMYLPSGFCASRLMILMKSSLHTRPYGMTSSRARPSLSRHSSGVGQILLRRLGESPRPSLCQGHRTFLWALCIWSHRSDSQAWPMPLAWRISGSATVLTMSMVTVIGPTPPGTGVDGGRALLLDSVRNLQYRH